MPIRLQARDKYLLGLLADDFLLLTREQIQQLIPRDVRRTNQRLALLTKDKFLSRREPVDQISPNAIFYYLGEKAADVLDVESIRERRVRAKNFGDSYLRHLHLINSVHIKFIIDKETGYGFRRWTPYDNTKWEGVQDFKLRPDGFVTFVKNRRPYAYFVEIDLGTERGNSIRRKIELYHRFDYSDRFAEEFKHDWFRVLFVTTEASRSAALRKLFPSKIFWTVTAAEMLSRPLFEPCWISKDRDKLGLYLGPDSEEVRRIEKRKSTLLAVPAPSTPKSQLSVRPQPASKTQTASTVIPKEIPRKKLNWRFWLKLAKGLALICIVALLGFGFYCTYKRMQSYPIYSPDPQVYETVQNDASDETIKLVITAGALIAVTYIFLPI